MNGTKVLANVNGKEITDQDVYVFEPIKSTNCSSI